MAKTICIQVGHQNIKFNTDAALSGSTGAPQEMQTNYNIVCRTAELLRARGFTVKQTDANANSDPTIIGQDWDLYLSVHCDSDSALLSGGFTDWPDPTTDGATIESQRIANAIADKFFPETGIVFRPERRQKSTGVMYYYMWKYLSMKTPCVLIEMGESVDAHDRVILNDTERCAVALARGVCQAFSVAYEQAQPPVVQPPVVEPPVVQPPVIPPAPPIVPTVDYKSYLQRIKVVMAKGFFWVKLAGVNQIIKESGI
jgi:N-acetylmuramoyl-L-alanine amidase